MTATAALRNLRDQLNRMSPAARDARLGDIIFSLVENVDALMQSGGTSFSENQHGDAAVRAPGKPAQSGIVAGTPAAGTGGGVSIGTTSGTARDAALAIAAETAAASGVTANAGAIATEASTRAAADTVLTNNLIGPTTAAVFTSNPAYGIKADVQIVQDGAMTAGSNVVTSASGRFVPGDTGKMIVVEHAGAPLVSTTLSAALSTGAAITSLPVVALSAAIPAGWVVVTSGANTQMFGTAGAASGATSIVVDSLAPTFAFPSGASCTSPPQHIYSTMTYVSATTCTVGVNASVTVSGVDVTWCTDNTVGLASAYAAAIAAGVSLTVVGMVGYATFPTVTSRSVGFIGLGVSAVTRAGIASDIDDDNFPTVAPYLSGSVLVCMSANADALPIFCGRYGGIIRDLGIMFGGKFLSTGHGIHALGPVVGSVRDSGLFFPGEWSSIKIFGHDGNHYGLAAANSLQVTVTHLHIYGGGGIWYYAETTGATQYGNAVFVHPYHVGIVAGTAHAYLIQSLNSQQINKIVFMRPQSNMDAFGSGTNPTQGTYRMACRTLASNVNPQLLVTSAGTVGPTNTIQWYSPDMENGGASLPAYPSGTTCAVYSPGSGNPSFTSINGNPASGTVYQNLTATPIVYTAVFDMLPTTTVAASVLCNIGGSTPTIVACSVIEAANPSPVTNRRTVFFLIPAGYYYKLTMVGATLVSQATQTLYGM